MVVQIQPLHQRLGVDVGVGGLLRGLVGAFGGGGGVVLAVTGGGRCRQISAGGVQFGGGQGGLNRHGAAAALGEGQVQPRQAVGAQPGCQHAVVVGGGCRRDDGVHPLLEQRFLPTVVGGRGGRDAHDGIDALLLQRLDLPGGVFGKVGGGEYLAVKGRKHGAARLVQAEKADFVPGALDHGGLAVGDLVAVPTGGTVQNGGAVGVLQVGSQCRPGGHVGVAQQAAVAVGHVPQADGLQVVPGGGEGAHHIHAAGHAGHGGAVQAVAGIHQNGVGGARLLGGGIGNAVAAALQAGRGKNGHRDVTHPHNAGKTLGAVGQRGGQGALARVGAGTHGAVFVHGSDIFIAGRPENVLRLGVVAVGGQGGAVVLVGQVQLPLAGVVHEFGVGKFADAILDAGGHKGPYDKVQVDGLALDAVVCAHGLATALPHIVDARVAQLVGEARDPQVFAPGVKGGVGKTAAHPVQRGVQPLLARVAVLGQAVKKRLHNFGHLVRQHLGNVFVLQVVVDGVAELVGHGGVVAQFGECRGDQTQQAGDVVGLAAGFLHRGGVGVKVHAKRDAQAGALVGVAAELRVVLVPVFLLPVPFAAKATAQNGVVDTGGLGLFPVDLALIARHVHALQNGGGYGAAGTVKVVAQLVFLPRGRGCAEVRRGGGCLLDAAAHKGNAHGGSQQHADKAEHQHTNGAALAAAFWRGRTAGRRIGCGFARRRRGACTAVYIAFFCHDA